ncbi:hypothetical protein C6Y14_15210 [Streptomyces dioscori]|uniref:Uncharacterized protein n=1 Tax=Streptomyces dioscori TaxID=2109333 RepID=A0A2P8Q8J5_9ACTN|nr:hypothetical protein C6Y14_15210 [Streptomyces dioscori]
MDWSAAEAGDDAEASESGFFSSAAGDALAFDFFFESESESLEHPPRATTAASVAPAIELIRLVL